MHSSARPEVSYALTQRRSAAREVPINSRAGVLLQEQAWVKQPIVNTLVSLAIAAQAVTTCAAGTW